MKTYIIDTNVILNDWSVPFKLSEKNKVIIPQVVINELDTFKKDKDSLGFNSRKFSHKLIKLLNNSKKQQLKNIVKITKNLLVDVTVFNDIIPDAQILEVAMSHNSKNTILITNDVNLAITANLNGVNSEGQISNDTPYSGVQVIELKEQEAYDLYKSGYRHNNKKQILNPNEILVFRFENKMIGIGLALKDSRVKILRCDENGYVKSKWNQCKPRNKEQSWLLYLLNELKTDKLDLLTIQGKAGAGKTLIALDKALEMVDEGIFNKVILSKPIATMGEQEVGFLPGTLEAKMNPIMESYSILLKKLNKLSGESLYGKMDKKFDEENEFGEKKPENKQVEFKLLTHIRGCNINDLVILDECFPGNQRVLTKNGKMTIRQIFYNYNNTNNVTEVLSFNNDKEKFEYKKVTGAFKKRTKHLLEIKSGNKTFKCTENHKFLTNEGWKQAKTLNIGDILLTNSEEGKHTFNVHNDDQKQIVLGSYLGDGFLQLSGKNNRYRLKILHGIKQKLYCEWKAHMFNTKTTIIKENGFSKKPAIKMLTKIFTYNKSFGNKKHCPQWILDELDERGLAIWFMDDGSISKKLNSATISTCSFDSDSQERIVKRLNSFGIECRITRYKHKNRDYKEYSYINILKNGVDRLIELIEKYIPTSDMFYKIGKVPKTRYPWNNKFKSVSNLVVDKVNKITTDEDVYDITVEDNHNFIITGTSSNSGPIVHNCQNLSKHEVKSIITRLEEGAKIIIIADTDQIDVSYLNKKNNGFTHLVERLKELEFTAHITLIKSERGRLAEAAGNLL